METTFRRMVVIPEQEYINLKKKIQPQQKEIGVDIEQKLQAHKAIEEQHMEENSKPQPSPPTPLPLSLIKTAIEKFPIQRRARAAAILKQLENNNQIKWDDNGQLIDDEEGVISNSHILDLIYYATHTEKQAKANQPSPPGWSQIKPHLPPKTKKRTHDQQTGWISL